MYGNMAMPGMPGSGGGMKMLLVALVVLGGLAGLVFWMKKKADAEPEDTKDKDADATKPPGTKPPRAKDPAPAPPVVVVPQPQVVPAPVKPTTGAPVVVATKCDQECAKKCKDPKSSKCAKCMSKCNGGGGGQTKRVCRVRKDLNSYCKNLKCKTNDPRGACNKCLECKDEKQEGFMMYESYENGYPLLHALQTYRDTIMPR
jgi:hypothetical protein